MGDDEGDGCKLEMLVVAEDMGVLKVEAMLWTAGLMARS